MSARPEALTEAMEMSYADVVAALDAGANPNEPTEWGEVPLLVAAALYPEFVPLLLERGGDARLVHRSDTTHTVDTTLTAILRGVESRRADEQAFAAFAALIRGGADVNFVDSRPLLEDFAREVPDTRYVALLLDSGADPNKRGSSGSSALHSVSARRWGVEERTEALRLLLDRGADPNQVDGKGRTPLFVALGCTLPQEASLANVNVLLDAGANPSHVDAQGLSVLAAARKHASSEIVAALLLRGAQPRSSEGLVSALLAGDEEAARTRLTTSDVNESKDGTTALLAASEHAPAVVAALLAAGADPLSESIDGESALHKVAKAGLGLRIDDVTAAAEALIAAGLSPNKRSSKGRSPLGIALSHFGENAIGLIEALLEAGADPNAAEEQVMSGYRMLAIAAFGGKPTFLDALLRRGAGIEELSLNESVTPLLSIWQSSDGTENVRIGRMQCLHKLLAAGANPNARGGREGGTLLHKVAASTTGADAVKALLDAGADPNVRDARGNSPLHVACSWGLRTAVDLLLSRGADINAQNQKGATPVDVSQEELRMALEARDGRTGQVPSVWSAFGIAEGEHHALLRAVESLHGVKLHPAVAHFIADETDPQGPLRLGRFSETYMERSTFDRLFARFGQELFPGIRLGQTFGVDVWLMLESERVITVHHDSFFDVVGEVTAHSRADFVRDFVARASAMTLTQLLAIQGAGLGVDIETDEGARVMLKAIANVLGRPLGRMKRELWDDLRLEILRELCRPAL